MMGVTANPENVDHPELRVYKAHRDHLGHRASVELQVSQEVRVKLGHRARLDHRDSQEKQAETV